MATLARLDVAWTGSTVRGGGVNVLFFDVTTAGPDVDAVLAAYQGLIADLPSSVTITVPNSGDTIDDATGQLVGTWTNGTGGSVVGNSPGGVAAGAGARVAWTTTGIVAGRRVRGRTFLVPLQTGSWSGSGDLAPDVVSRIQAFGDAMVAVPGFVIWSRPRPLSPGSGGSASVVSAKAASQTAILSSRRD